MGFTSIVTASYGGGGGGSDSSKNGGNAGLYGLGGTAEAYTSGLATGQSALASSYGSGGGGGGNTGKQQITYKFKGGSGAPGVVIFYYSVV